MNSLTKSSSQIQLILDLATYGYILAPGWKTLAKARTSQELRGKFFEAMSRWEIFDYTAKLHCRSEEGSRRMKGGIVGCIGSQNVYLYHLDRLRDQAQLRAAAGTKRNIKPWITHLLSGRSTTFDWDIAQDVLVYQDYDTQ